jgi:hypothetical protein
MIALVMVDGSGQDITRRSDGPVGKGNYFVLEVIRKQALEGSRSS